MEALAPLVTILPFLGATLIGFGGLLSPGFRKQEGLIGAIATAAVFIPFMIVVGLFAGYSKPVDVHVLDWMRAGDFNLAFSYRFDELSLLMGLIVTGVGTLIHIYSIGYMHHDPGFYKYFLYLNLFIFSMNNLILGDNMIVTFLGWEGVGACSYFLIGFWYKDMEKCKAAQKAFVANRVGDFAFLVAIFITYATLGTLTYSEIALTGDTAFWVALLVFIAATGKSAQIPLYVWLPDAMAGPTPVSALIHAATMVTSGIYLIARLSASVYLHAPGVLMVVAVVGALTALMAALIAISQNDIKKVLAYSTVSQLGFMFMALGAGAFTTAIFHVMTHAFFKACLFLGSGSVIHAMDHTHAVDDPQDIRTMGGLGKYMPSTSKTFWISTIAIAGIPGFAGFFSKDEILAKNFAMGYDGHSLYYLIFAIGLLTAFLTAFYMTRVTYLTFNGKPRFDDQHHPPHESPALMTIPLWILAGLAIVGGYLGLPEVIGHGHYNWISHHWLNGAVTNFEVHMPPLGVELFLIALSIGIAVTGMLLSYNLYKKNGIDGDLKVKSFFGGLYKTLENKFYVDELYNAAIVRPFVLISQSGVMPFDKQIIDGLVNGSGWMTQQLGLGFRTLQSGLLQNYTLLMAIGVVLALAYFLIP
jgi:NADH-quinone oxidoreductase subunit L